MSALSLLLSVALAQAYYSPEEAKTLFEQANEAYYKQHPDEAKAGFEKLLQHGYGGPDVLYNLGTVYLSQNDVGRAILMFERARRAGGRAGDIDANLALARARQVDQVVGVLNEEPFVSRVVGATDPWVWSWVLVFSWGIAFAFLIAFRFLKRGRRAWAALAAAVALAVAVPSGAIVAMHAYARTAVTEAVVIPSVLSIKEFPREEAKVAFEVHAGLKVRLLEDAGKYVRIHLPNGLEGWAARDGVEAL